jgi:hypothetical protein
MLAENLGRLARDSRVRHPKQHMIDGPARQRCGVKERLDHLRRLSGVETGGVVPTPTLNPGIWCRDQAATHPIADLRTCIGPSGNARPGRRRTCDAGYRLAPS